MARDTKDKATIPLIPEAKKRGRPSTGNAMSAADRKRLQRSRNKDHLWQALVKADGDIKTVTVTALLEQLSRFCSEGDPDLVAAISKELVRRAKINRDNP